MTALMGMPSTWLCRMAPLINLRSPLSGQGMTERTHGLAAGRLHGVVASHGPLEPVVDDQDAERCLIPASRHVSPFGSVYLDQP